MDLLDLVLLLMGFEYKLKKKKKKRNAHENKTIDVKCIVQYYIKVKKNVVLKYDWDTKPGASSLMRKTNQLLASLTPSLLLKQNHFAKLCFQTCERGMVKPTLEDGAHPLPYAKTRY